MNEKSATLPLLGENETSYRELDSIDIFLKKRGV